MKLRLPDLFREAAAYWEADRDLLLRVAGVFYLLPSLALNLFVAPLSTTVSVPVDGAVATEAQAAAQQAELLAWFAGFWPWMMAAIAVQLLGTTIILTMLLSPDRPALGDAILRAVRTWPNVVLGWLLATIACTLGFFAFILPGFYLAGRTYLTSATIVAEGRGATGGLMRGIQITRGHGWLLTTAYISIVLANMVVGTMLGGFTEGTQGTSSLIAGLLILLTSAVSAFAALASTLLQAAAYRRLAGSRTGM